VSGAFTTESVCYPIPIGDGTKLGCFGVEARDRIDWHGKYVEALPKPPLQQKRLTVTSSNHHAESNHSSAGRSEMKGLFRFRKTVAVLTGVGVGVIVAGVAAFANSGTTTVCFPNNGGAISTTPCDPATETAVTLSTFAPVIRDFDKRYGPSNVAGDGVYHTVITMTDIPNGFYKVESNGALDPVAEGATGRDWACQLVFQNVDNGQGVVEDYWEAEGLADATYFLKAAINMSSSNGTNSLRVDCLNDSGVTWNTEWLKIIAVDASDLISQAGS
jgi:hypothetical protein